MKWREFWERNKSWLQLLGTALISIAAGAYAMYKFVASDVPTFKGELADFKTLLEKHMDQERTSIKTIKVSLLLLTEKVNKRPLTKEEITQMLSSIQDISVDQAQHLAMYENVVGPPVPTPHAFYDLSSFKVSNDVITAWQLPSPTSKAPVSIDKILRHSFFAKKPTWEARNDRLMLKYDGGAVTFIPKSDVTQADLALQASLLNDLSKAVAAVMDNSLEGTTAYNKRQEEIAH